MGYSKILVARYNPKNYCYANEGEALVIAQKEDKPKKKLPNDHHFFVGTISKESSRYGWVFSLDHEITSEELACKYNENPSNELIESCELLLNSIATHDDNTPIACTYSKIYLQNKKVLKVHKVLFYKG
jgi:flavin-dependent dehydrogenase